MSRYPKVARWALLAGCVLGIALTGIPASRGEPAPAAKRVASVWPGIEFELTRVVRVSADRLLLVIRVYAGPGTANPTLLGIRSAQPKGGADHPDDESVPIEPFSLKSATLEDLTTRQTYRAVAALPFKPYFGPNAVVTTMRPNEWVQMSVQIPAPPPLPPNDAGLTPEQKVSITVPHAKAPFSNVVLPPLSGS